MKSIPVDSLPDSTAALLFEGYKFISKRCHRYHSDIFQTRLLFEETICMRGEEATRKFYDTSCFKRNGAAPSNIQATLFGTGGIQTLDGKAHKNRKKLFMNLMSTENISHLDQLVTQQWQSHAIKWEQSSEVVLFDEVQEFLCRAACTWAGVPLKNSEAEERTYQFAAMIDGSGSYGLHHLIGWRGRVKTEKWIEKLIQKVRYSELAPSRNSILQTFAVYRDVNGKMLDKHTAAVELINVLRPVVAIARFITFAALAIHENPENISKLQSDDEEYLTCFMQEVRRFYPFFPFVAAIVRKNFEWNGYQFPEGQRVLLDLYGTNHDGQIWENPYQFNAKRFQNKDINPYNLIPQGGGDYHQNHRCPGEWITQTLLKSAINFLVNEISYGVPEQNLNIRLSRMPTIPQSRFVINNVTYNY